MPEPTNWKAALDLRDLETLALIIDLVLEFAQLTGRRITPGELLNALQPQ